ncbi:hypothetical protein [Spirosoma fluviale]|uniref:Lipoprotein n=1 Tax=Spirosoma fluviale TaxID=1597977 RepID=A0A286FXZ8_9BACT|nr:hypothetical protein [Spirosoma fluviale]SOD88072.1 hypothetical protein SAMN06269250_2484 [Spirosoma fluviale]
MKTTHNAFALLFAAITFTACTSQSVEPVRPTSRPQSVMYADSTLPDQAMPGQPDRSEKIPHGVATVDQEPGGNPYQPLINTPLPQPKPLPRQAVMPVVESDSLAQY